MTTKKLTLPTIPNLIWGAITAAILLYAVWLVSPFFKIEAADYLRAAKLGLRLAVGISIFLIFAGKWSFDIFAPQGLAKKVSGIKAVGLIVFDLLLVVFIVFIVAQAASLYLQTGIAQDEANY
jgi:hypothetical protein